MSLKLYGYWRSSATYRVRIALNLKGLEYEYVPVHLVMEGGQQHQEGYDRLNPAHLVPTFVDDDEDIILNQSLSIIEYLDEINPRAQIIGSINIVYMKNNKLYGNNTDWYGFSHRK